MYSFIFFVLFPNNIYSSNRKLQPLSGETCHCQVAAVRYNNFHCDLVVHAEK